MVQPHQIKISYQHIELVDHGLTCSCGKTQRIKIDIFINVLNCTPYLSNTYREAIPGIFPIAVCSRCIFMEIVIYIETSVIPVTVTARHNQFIARQGTCSSKGTERYISQLTGPMCKRTGKALVHFFLTIKEIIRRYL